jgi:micrococcal nuclease
LAVLVGVAGVLWLAAEPPSSIMEGNGASAMSGNGTFALCVRASQQNCVIDGDTIRYGGTKIRLEDIDAPEVSSPKCASEAALARQATRRLAELLNAGPFELVSRGSDEDRYGRKLRVIARDGRSVGDTLIAEGLARRWDGARRSWCGVN